MSMTNFLFTSESVTEGHPDKVADQISDAILDSMIKDDKKSRVACETLVSTGLAIIAGEITTQTWVDMPEIIRNTIKEIGYTDASMGFDFETCAVITTIDKQSPDISQGVTAGVGLHKEQGAGDQGLMFGFATDDTPELMPMPIIYAHKVCRQLAKVRKDGLLDFLRPDGKSQVTVEYVDDKPVRVDAVVVAAQHSESVKYDTLREGIIEEVIKKVIPENMMDKKTKFHINATGRFVLGGPQADCGLTGRKIIVDTYGGQGSHGGGAFSGKDPSKVDRSGSYMARYVAKNIVAAGLAKKCEVQVAYAIGVAEPVSLMIDTGGTSVIPPDQIARIVSEVFDFRPAAMIEKLDLLNPIFKNTAAYGHFGREDEGFKWEERDMADTLKKEAGI
jgi:S-adenosylmethionine synthetase